MIRQCPPPHRFKRWKATIQGFSDTYAFFFLVGPTLARIIRYKFSKLDARRSTRLSWFFDQGMRTCRSACQALFENRRKTKKKNKESYLGSFLIH
jgi:hypothetical protein